MFADSREPLVEVALQVLCVSLDNEPAGNVSVDGTTGGATAMEPVSEVGTLIGCTLLHLEVVTLSGSLEVVTLSGSLEVSALSGWYLTIAALSST